MKKNQIFLYNKIYTISLSFIFCSGIVLFIYEICKQLILTFMLGNGTYNWWYFPFQLCSIPMYIAPTLPRCKNIFFKNTLLCFLATYSLMGGVVVFADTSGLHYPYIFLTVCSYLWHILLIMIGIAAGIALTMDKKKRSETIFSPREKSSPFSLKLFGASTLLYLCCCAAAEIINLSCDRLGTINMFYINPHYRMQQIVFRSIVPYAGNTGTIFVYIFSAILGALLFLIIWKLFFRFICCRRKRFS